VVDEEAKVIGTVFAYKPVFFTKELSMKTLKLAIVAAAAAVMMPAQAEGLSYSVGASTANTDDVRGDDFRPSLNLGADYDFGNGFYAGTGFTSGKYAEDAKSRGELTLSVGYGQELASGLFYDINATRYIYSKAGGNLNELGLTVGYGPVSATYYKAFDSSKFVSKSDYLDVAYTYSFTDKLDATLTVTKGRAEDESWSSSLDYELAASYDLGNNLSATASINKYKPKFVLGLTKSF